MANDFKFNWGGPTLQELGAAYMQGYRPLQNMDGYVPSRAPDAVAAPVVANQPAMQGGEGGQQRGVMWGANNYGQGQAYTDKIAALQDEYNRNEARIAEIESKIASLKGQISDNAKRRDQLDMQLAANRAGIGDIGNSIAHQNAIETRKQQEYLRQLEAKRQGSAEDSTYKDVIDAYTELAYAPDEKTQALAQFKVEEALKKYEKKNGKPFGVNPLDVKRGGAKAGDVATTLERATGKYTASLDKNGRPTKAAKEEFLKDAEGLPYSKELQEQIDKVRNTETQEERKAKDAKVSKENQAAVDAVANSSEGLDLYTLEKKGSYTKTVGKKTVTVTKEGGYAIIKCGNQSKKVKL